MNCPNCGEDAGFTEHSSSHVETHGLDCGPYERWEETWLTCNACRAETDQQELDRIAKTEHEETMDLRTSF